MILDLIACNYVVNPIGNKDAKNSKNDSSFNDTNTSRSSAVGRMFDTFMGRAA